MRTARLLWWAGLLALGWAILTFLYTPIGTVLWAAFTKDGTATADAITRLASTENVRRSLTNTLWMTGATLITVNVVGLFQVAVLEFFQVRGQGLLKLAFATPLVFSSVTAIAGYTFVYGENGAVTALMMTVFGEIDRSWFSGWPAVLIAHTFLMTHYHFLFLRAAIRQVDFSLVEAARSLGMGPVMSLVRVVFPVLAPTIFAVSLLVLLAAITSFAAPALLGGRDFRMISQMILGLASLRRTDMAAMLALMLGVVALIVFILLQWIERRGRYHGGARTPMPIQKIPLKNPVANVTVHAFAYVLFVIYATPVLLTVAFSFASARTMATQVIPTEFTLANYTAVLTDPRRFEPLANSVTMSVIAVAIVLAVSLFACHVIARRRTVATTVLEFSLFIPWVLPSALVAIGLITAFAVPNPLLFGQVLIGSYWILPVAYAILVLPMMVRLIGAAMVGLDPSLDDAARSLGAPGFYRFRRITLPLLMPVLILVAALGFNDLVNEYTVSAFLYNANNTPLGVAIAAGAQQSYDPEQTAKTLVYVTLVMGFSFAVILIADRIGLGKSRLSPV